MSLKPMNHAKNLPQVTSTNRIYQLASFILQMAEKAVNTTAKMQLTASSSVFLALTSIGQPKPNQPLEPIQQTPRSTPLIGHQIGPMYQTHYKNIGFQVSDAPTPIYKESQSTIDIIK